MMLLGIFCFLLLTQIVAAQPSIQRHFSAFSDHRFIMLEEITQLENTKRINPYTTEILEEALFQSYSRWRVERQEKQDYLLEVFDLLDTSGAFSLLTLWPRFCGPADWKQLELPVGNHFRTGEGVFWRGNYLIKLTAAPGRTLTEEEFSELVRLFYENTHLENLYPVSVSHFPPQGLVRSSVEFYLGAASLALNERFPEPLLREIGFVDKIEIAFGKYELDDASLFVIGYPTPSLADEYFIRLQRGLRAFFSAEGIYMKRTGVLIAMLLGSEISAQQILGNIRYSPSVKWLYQKDSGTDSGEVRSFLGLLVRTILGTGVFILLIVAAGLVTGLIRYALLRRFPGLKRRKEMLRLNLDIDDHR